MYQGTGKDNKPRRANIMKKQLSQNTVSALESAGLSHWVKGDMDRIYINAKDLMDVDFYKSGNVQHAEINGEKISNTKATGLLNSKIYVDANTNEIVGPDELVDLAIAKYGLHEASEEDAEAEAPEASEESSKPVVEFSETSDTEVDVFVDKNRYGKLQFDAEQDVWVLWPIQIDDGVSYFEDLAETEETITDEIQIYNED